MILRRRSDLPPLVVEPGVCSHCRADDPTTSLRRIGLLGLVSLCDPCTDALAPLYGSQLEREPVLRGAIA